MARFPPEVAGLDEAWQQRQQDALYMNMIERQFDPANRVAWGTAWWEERQRGRHGTVRRITTADLVEMWLSDDPPPGAPRARPWCPEILAGSWRLAGVSKNGRDVAAPDKPREWTPHPDGRLTSAGDPGHDGWTWCANQGPGLYLWLYRPGDPIPRVWYVDRVERGEMDVYPPDDAPGFLRWQRTS